MSSVWLRDSVRDDATLLPVEHHEDARPGDVLHVVRTGETMLVEGVGVATIAVRRAPPGRLCPPPRFEPPAGMSRRWPGWAYPLADGDHLVVAGRIAVSTEPQAA